MDAPLSPRAAAEVLAVIADRCLAGAPAAPALGGVTLAPHQVEAVARLLPILDACGGALLADAPGMGKTFVALAVAAQYADVAIAAPAALRDMWSRALRRTGVHAAFHSLEAMGRPGWRAGEPRPRLVVVDEAHHARNPRTRRYDALAALTTGARVLLLSATPLHNDAHDLAALFALFLGGAAASLDDRALAQLIVRRRDPAGAWRRLPGIAPLRRLAVPRADDLLDALLAVPPAVPGADGRVAHALMQLGLLRAFASSDAALGLTLRRRALRATALATILDAGRWPTRRDLASWTCIDGALQLGFTELLVPTGAPAHQAALRQGLAEHLDGIARVRALLAGGADRDAVRVAHLRRLRRRHPGVPIVAFTSFADTARAFFRRLRAESGVALVSSGGARIASGPVGRDAVLRALDPVNPRRDSFRGPVTLLLATDVLSEGLDLHRAGVVVHLDLPWTAARLEQRVGRVRRPGGPNEEVFAYAVAPPGGLRRLRPVWQALRRKARLMRRLGGETELDVHAPLLEGPGSPARAGHGRDPASLAEAVRTRLAGLRLPDVAVPAGAGVVAWSEAGDVPARWTALALAELAGVPRLAVLWPTGISESPSRVVQVLDLARDRAAGSASAPAPAHARCAVREAEARAARWLAGMRASGLLVAAFRTPSAGHRRALREIDRLVAGAARDHRPALAALAEAARAVVLDSAGAGAERLLARWLDAGPLHDTLSAPSRLEALIGLLAPGGSRGSTPDRRSASIRALLVLVRPSGES